MAHTNGGDGLEQPFSSNKRDHNDHPHPYEDDPSWRSAAGGYDGPPEGYTPQIVDGGLRLVHKETGEPWSPDWKREDTEAER